MVIRAAVELACRRRITYQAACEALAQHPYPEQAQLGAAQSGASPITAIRDVSNPATASSAPSSAAQGGEGRAYQPDLRGPTSVSGPRQPGGAGRPFEGAAVVFCREGRDSPPLTQRQADLAKMAAWEAANRVRTEPDFGDLQPIYHLLKANGLSLWRERRTGKGQVIYVVGGWRRLCERELRAFVRQFQAVS